MSKVAVVTGGAKGIGKGIVERLVADGYSVVVADLDKAAAEATAKEVNDKGGKAVAAVGDASLKETHHAYVKVAVDTFGRLDTYINNAGVARIKLLEDETPEDIERVFKINVYGTIYGMQAATEQFDKQNDGDKTRKIINAASIAAHIAFDILGVYSATKFAVRALTQAGAKELGKRNITVNAYCPGIVGTEMWGFIDAEMCKLRGGNEGDWLNTYSKNITLGRVQTPEDVANFVSFLASTDSDYITGQSVQTCGGIQFV